MTMFGWDNIGTWLLEISVTLTPNVVARAREGVPSKVEIAFESGFGGYERMRRTFIRRLGISPITYRKRFGRPDEIDNRVDFDVLAYQASIAVTSPATS